MLRICLRVGTEIRSADLAMIELAVRRAPEPVSRLMLAAPQRAHGSARAVGVRRHRLRRDRSLVHWPERFRHGRPDHRPRAAPATLAECFHHGQHVRMALAEQPARLQPVR